MSKKALTSYLSSLDKGALEQQLTDLYLRFPVVKEYYDFVFNPKEGKLVHEAKVKIANEYFPLQRKRPKARRSVAQKCIRHFVSLGVDPHLVADVMLYNLETAQTFSINKNNSEAFYKSIFNSFYEVLRYISSHGLLPEYKGRLLSSNEHTQKLEWPNREAFSRALDQLEE